MPVPFPASSWPTTLDERGPPEDPTILLSGTAKIGAAAVRIVAIRINSVLRRTADYRAEVPAGSYRRDEFNEVIDTALEDLDALLQEFDELLEGKPARLVELAGHPYAVWMVSATLGS